MRQNSVWHAWVVHVGFLTTLSPSCRGSLSLSHPAANIPPPTCPKTHTHCRTQTMIIYFQQGSKLIAIQSLSLEIDTHPQILRLAGASTLWDRCPWFQRQFPSTLLRNSKPQKREPETPRVMNNKSCQSFHFHTTLKSFCLPRRCLVGTFTSGPL
jgi:hypothetical protein